MLLGGVVGGGPAEQAGLQKGDVIVEIAGQTIANIYDYTYALDVLKIGQPAKVIYMRDGKKAETTLTPARESSRYLGGRRGAELVEEAVRRSFHMPRPFRYATLAVAALSSAALLTFGAIRPDHGHAGALSPHRPSTSTTARPATSTSP